MAHGVKAEIRK